MLSSIVCACVCVALIQAAPLPEGLHFIGVGYNLLRGNPDGNFWSAGGDDPGLLSTRKVLTLSDDSVPTEIVYEYHDVCRKSNEFTLFYDPQSYQNKLLESITSSGNSDTQHSHEYSHVMEFFYVIFRIRWWRVLLSKILKWHMSGWTHFHIVSNCTNIYDIYFSVQFCKLICIISGFIPVET